MPAPRRSVERRTWVEVSRFGCFIRCGSSSLASIVVFPPLVKGTHDSAPTLSIERRAGVFSATEATSLDRFPRWLLGTYSRRLRLSYREWCHGGQS